MIKGLYETHLFVENLERSRIFYSTDLKLTQCYIDKERRAVFFWIGKPKQFLLGLWEKPKELIDVRHFAFECDPEWILNESVKYLNERNIKSWNFLEDGIQRPMVFAWMPAISIYFEDPDGHLLEFIGILEGESKPEKGVITYDEWNNLNS